MTTTRNTFIHEIIEVLKEMKIEVMKGLTPSRAVINSINCMFGQIKDPRKTVDDDDYSLITILGTAFLAILSGANTWVEIADFASAKRAWLCRFYPEFRKKHNFQNKIHEQSRYTPAHDTFRRILGLIPMYELQTVLRSFLRASIDQLLKTCHIVTEESRTHIAIDGKVERGTGRNYSAKTGGKVSDTQTLNVYNSTYGMTEYSFPIDSKTNEIPVAQRALAKMNLCGVIVTADALHTQTNTCRLIHNAHGDYVLGLKGNQPSAMDIAADVFGDEKALQDLMNIQFTNKEKGATRKAHKYYRCETEKAHGQIEKREIYIYPISKLPKPLADELTDKWPGLKSLVCSEKTITPCDPGKEATHETRYYIASLEDVDVIFTYIRRHWAIEAHHFDADVTFANDANSTMDKVSLENLFFIMKAIRTFLEYARVFFEGQSLNRMRKSIGWNDDLVGVFSILFCSGEDFVQKYKTEFTEKELAKLKELYDNCCNL